MARPQDDLGFKAEELALCFRRELDTPYALVRVSAEDVAAWADTLHVAVRRCYISDALLVARSAELDLPPSDILAARLPDPGSTMAGDFGEILTYLLLACEAYPQAAVGPKKWRLKQDRTKPAPLSDVVHLILPDWPQAGASDCLMCAEVKTKATSGASSPIADAIRDSEKDRTSRLSRTLVWLRERAIIEDLGDVSIEDLTRFIESDHYPPYEKRFIAVAVICATLLEAELAGAPIEEPPECSLIVVAVPDLKAAYTAVYADAKRSSAVSQPERPTAK